VSAGAHRVRRRPRGPSVKPWRRGSTRRRAAAPRRPRANTHGSIGVGAAARDSSGEVAGADLRRIADEQLRSAFDHAPIGMALVDLHGGCLHVNPALCAILGYSADELSGRAFHEITHPDDLDADVELFGELLGGRVPSYQLEKRYLRGDGATIWAQLSVSLARDEHGDARNLVAQVQDITERKRLDGELERLATRDDLTGLHNRRFFERALEEQLRRVERYGERAAVLVLDLDDFKSVNDTLGHHAGDQLLEHVGKVVSERLRSSDVVARLGGDEFAVLLPHADAESAGDVAAALQAEFARQPAHIEGHAILAASSIGVAVLAAADSVDDALRRADRAMYRAKRAYRGR
jgi:diguanylate cyclase (GGDEF)-like protein/PAS domain S-box-containing protein